MKLQIYFCDMSVNRIEIVWLIYFFSSNLIWSALIVKIKAQQQQSMHKPLPKPKPPPPTHSRSTRAATSAINSPPPPVSDGQPAENGQTVVTGEKRKSLTNGEISTKERKRSKCNGRMAPPTQNGLPPPVLGTVTFLGNSFLTCVKNCRFLKFYLEA